MRFLCGKEGSHFKRCDRGDAVEKEKGKPVSNSKGMERHKAPIGVRGGCVTLKKGRERGGAA